MWLTWMFALIWYLKRIADWDYLCALNDIDKLNQERKEKVQSQVNWIQRYWDLLHFYSSCVICDSEGGSLSCQVSCHYEFFLRRFKCLKNNLYLKFIRSVHSYCRLVVLLVLRRLCSCFAMRVTTMILWKLKKCVTQGRDPHYMRW